MDRYTRIVELSEIIRKAGTISIRDLEAQYAYSFSTMQRDLNYLLSMGVIERKYGKIYAKSLDVLNHDKSKAPPSIQFCKEAIGHMAQCLLKPNETIYITHGSTTFEVARAFNEHVCHKVFTDGLNVLEALRSKPNIRTFCLAGSINFPSQRIERSPYVSTSFPNVNINHIIMGVAGLSIKKGITFYDYESADFLSQIIPQCEEIIVVADHTKLDRVATVHFDEISIINYLVTDSLASPDQLKNMEDLGIKCIVAQVGNSKGLAKKN